MISIALLATCTRTGETGMVSFSDRRAIGARVGEHMNGVGLSVVQGLPNPRMERWALRRISEGATPQESAIAAVMRDTLSIRRQILILDITGHSAARQGKQVPKRAHHIARQNFVVGGTGLPTIAPVSAMANIMEETEAAAVPLENRLMAALEETCRNGGWVKGEPQSSFLRLYHKQSHPPLDLRIDSSHDAVHELRILLDQSHLENPERIATHELGKPVRREHAA